MPVGFHADNLKIGLRSVSRWGAIKMEIIKVEKGGWGYLYSSHSKVRGFYVFILPIRPGLY